MRPAFYLNLGDTFLSEQSLRTGTCNSGERNRHGSLLLLDRAGVARVNRS